MTMNPLHKAPSYRLVVDGMDITPKVNGRLISLTLTDNRGDEADILEIVLSDHDGAMTLSPHGAVISVALGWKGEDLLDSTRFGDLPLKSINRLMIRRYLDIAEQKVGANRRIQYLKAAWNWASQRYPQVPQSNPCEGVTLNKENSRTRYVEDWEYDLVQDIILQKTRSHYMAVMMEFAYLCRLRNAEVRNLRHSDISNGYLRIERGKGSLGELTRISPRLQAAINAAKAMYPDAPVPVKGAYLLHDKKGLKISKNRFDSAWQRMMIIATTEGLVIEGASVKLNEKYVFHDLKAKGVTDHTEQWAGHKSEKARSIYIRKLRQIDATR